MFWKLTIPLLFLTHVLLDPLMDAYKVLFKQYPIIICKFFNNWHLMCYPNDPLVRLLIAYKKAEKLEHSVSIMLNGNPDPVLDEIRTMKLELETKIKQLADA